jgi:hypothetical protein
MANAGTLLTQLDGKPPVFNNDDDIVKKIMSEMNQPSMSNPVMMHPMPGPSMNQNQMMQAPPSPNSTFHMTSDPSPATAHVIGNSYPTNADMANMLNQHAYPQQQQPMYGQMQGGMASQMMPTLMNVSKDNAYMDLFIQMKQPIIVAIIVFVVSLPAINILIGHYVPSLLRMGGDLTTAGLVVKSAVGGFLFWFIQKVLVPLMMV